MSRCSGFPEAFVHAALFYCFAHTVFGGPSPGHGKENLCANSLTGRNKVTDTPCPSRSLDHSRCITNCIFWGGFMEETRCLNRCLWRFRKTFGTETLSFCRCCTVRITECSQMNKWYSQTCKCVLQVIFDTRNVEIPVKTRTLCEGRTPCI